MSRRENHGAFVKQAAILAGASLFVRLLGFFYRLPLTDLIGDEGNAFYGSVYSAYTLAITLSSAFMIATISRLTSERVALKQFRNAHKLFTTAMIVSMFLGMTGFLFMFFGAEHIEALVFFNQEGVAAAIRAISPAVFVVSMLTVFRGYFQGMKTTLPTAVSQVVEQIFKVIFSLWLAYLFFDAANVSHAAAGAAAGTAIAAVSALIVVVIIYALVSNFLKKRIAEDETELHETRRSQVAEIFKMAYPIIICSAIFTLANLLDIRMANSRIISDDINILLGQFSLKFVLLTTLPVSLSLSLSSAVLPEIASSHVTLDQHAVRKKTNLALRLSMLISIPSAVGLAVLADPIVALLFPKHPEGGWLLRCGAVSIVFLGIVHVITGVLQGVGRVKIPVIAIFFGMIVKIPINYYLMAVPEINILGAVISTIACFFVAAVLNLFFLKYFTGIFPEIIGTFFKPTICAAGMGFVCFSAYNLLAMVSSNAVAALAAIAFGVVSYVALMILVRGFGKRELALLPIPKKIRRWLA
ncbi:MAG: polysaccharide biosynthesis protein [Defluviitaleaceae bacterium]|nr:polysaccharide biosynthesis protein [Defluviitaleaceae bacterium]